MPLFEAWMNSSFMTGHEMICYYLLDRRFFFKTVSVDRTKRKEIRR